MNRLDDQAIAWGKTNAHGEVRLKQLGAGARARTR